MKIAIQGIEASFHDIAAKQFFGEDIKTLSGKSFAECFQFLSTDQVDFAVVAIENSLYGSINTVYDLLLKYNFEICGEIYIRVEQCLIGLPEAKKSSISEVHSHPVALAQCELYLDDQLPNAERLEHHDTSGSVADIKAWGDPTKAAIASRQASDIHGLKILDSGIEDNKQNYTRFVVLQKNSKRTTDASKTSLIITTNHLSGALRNALNVFADQNINLSKLQSRPIIGKAWHYMFYIDVNCSAESPKFKLALRELTSQGCTVNLLGSYKAGI